MAFCGVFDLDENIPVGISEASSLILHLRLEPPASTAPHPGSRSLPRNFNSTREQIHRDFCSKITPSWHADENGLFLDLKGMERLYGPWAEGAGTICALAQREFPLWSAGLASSQLAAGLASSVAGKNGKSLLLAVPGGSLASFLAGFSIQVLGDHFREISKLPALGVHTLGDVQVLPVNLLVAVFGPAGHQISKESWGTKPEKLKAACGQPARLLVAQVHFSKPLVSSTGQKALRRALATRSLTRGVGRGQWFLVVRWSGGRRSSVSLPAPAVESWDSWLELMDALWSKLPPSRLGIRSLELNFQGNTEAESQQLGLFEEGKGAGELIAAISRIRQKFDPSFSSASEILLQQWGARWGTGS